MEHLDRRIPGITADVEVVDVATPPTGTLPDLAIARELWGSEKFIMGGIDATAQVEKSPEQMKEYVQGLLKTMGDGRRMALGTNDAVPKNAPGKLYRQLLKWSKVRGHFLSKNRP
jgi:hypothetical protein